MTPDGPTSGIARPCRSPCASPVATASSARSKQSAGELTGRNHARLQHDELDPIRVQHRARRFRGERRAFGEVQHLAQFRRRGNERCPGRRRGGGCAAIAHAIVSAISTDVTIATDEPANDTVACGVVTVSQPQPSATIGANNTDVQPWLWVSPSHPKIKMKKTGYALGACRSRRSAVHAPDASRSTRPQTASQTDARRGKSVPRHVQRDDGRNQADQCRAGACARRRPRRPRAHAARTSSRGPRAPRPRTTSHPSAR